MSNDNAGYCDDHQNNVVFTVSDDTARTTNITSDDPEIITENDSSSKSNDQRGKEEEAYHGMRSLILILALSLHHLFEGISLGLQRTVAGAFMLLIALLCHETIISFSLGLQFVKCSYSRKQHYITAFACSIVEPIGVAVGKLLGSESESSADHPEF